MRARASASAALLLLATAAVVSIRLLPLQLRGVAEPLAAVFRYQDAGGHAHVFLGDYDSYAWLRAARNLLRTGTACDDYAAGVCRDTYTLAPLGLPMPHPHSLHTAAIAAVQRVATAIDPAFPLPASAFLVPVLVGALGVVPAFAIGRRLAGPAGGFIAALAVSLQPLFLSRSIGSDNDVWNVVLPLYLVWAIIAAVRARRLAMQIGLAALAGLITALHALTWHGWTFGCTVILTGLGIAAALAALHWVVRERNARLWRARALRNAVVVALAYAISAAVLTTILAGDDWLLRTPGRLLGGAPVPSATAAPVDALRWPSALAAVSELAAPALSAIAAQSSGYLWFFVGWIGIVLLLLPRADWRAGHFAVLIAATVLYRLLLTWTGLGRTALIVLLLLPLAAAVLVDLREDTLDPDDLPAAVLIVTWFVAALVLSYEALRFVMLLAAPLGIAAGVAAGRASTVLDDDARTRWPAHPGLRRALGAAALLAVAAAPVVAGYRTAAAYLPSVDRSWAETFGGLRDAAPPDAIINAWWDYGHWAKYFAERRVATDGSTLLTHVPHWIARAQLAADEAEAVGILRMLDCGSDAEPYPEASRGAYGKLIAHGIDPRAAYALLARIVRLDRTAADDALAAAGLAAAARADVLASSHCTPPAAYLVLATQQVRLNGWWQLGTWRPPADSEPRGAAPAAPVLGLATPDWIGCDPVDGGMRRCEIGARLRDAAPVGAVTYRDGDPQSVRVHIVAANGGETTGPPDLLQVAANGGVTAPDADQVTTRGVGVLLDADHNRVLVGSPLGVASLYTRLLYLDGAGMTHFRKVDERTGRWGRVATWAIDW